MEKTFTIMRIVGDKRGTFLQTTDEENAYETATEYVFGMGGVVQLIERHDGKVFKVTQFECEGWDGEGEEPEVQVTVILEGV